MLMRRSNDFWLLFDFFLNVILLFRCCSCCGEQENILWFSYANYFWRCYLSIRFWCKFHMMSYIINNKQHLTGIECMMTNCVANHAPSINQTAEFTTCTSYIKRKRNERWGKKNIHHIKHNTRLLEAWKIGFNLNNEKDFWIIHSSFFLLSLYFL